MRIFEILEYPACGPPEPVWGFNVNVKHVETVMRNDSLKISNEERLTSDSRNELRLIILVVNELLLKTLEVSEMPSADLLTLKDSVNALQTQLVRQRTFHSCPGTRENSFRIDFSQKSRSQHGHLR